jgi:hypothetical protein
VGLWTVVALRRRRAPAKRLRAAVGAVMVGLFLDFVRSEGGIVAPFLGPALTALGAWVLARAGTGRLRWSAPIAFALVAALQTVGAPAEAFGPPIEGLAIAALPLLALSLEKAAMVEDLRRWPVVLFIALYVVPAIATPFVSVRLGSPRVAVILFGVAAAFLFIGLISLLWLFLRLRHAAALRAWSLYRPTSP